MAKFPVLLLALFANVVAAATTATSTLATTARIEMAILYVKPDATRNNGNTYRIYSAGSDDYILFGNTIPNAFPPPTGAGATQTNIRRLATDADRYLPPGTYLVELIQPLPTNTAVYDRCAIPHPTMFQLSDNYSTNVGYQPEYHGCHPARVIFTRPGEGRRLLFAGSAIIEFKKAANSTITNDGFHVKFSVANAHRGIDNATGEQNFTADHERLYGATIKFTKLK